MQKSNTPVYVVSFRERLGREGLLANPTEFYTLSYIEAQTVLGECLTVMGLNAKGEMECLHSMLSNERSLLNNITRQLLYIACWERYGFTNPIMKTVPVKSLTAIQYKALGKSNI